MTDTGRPRRRRVVAEGRVEHHQQGGQEYWEIRIFCKKETADQKCFQETEAPLAAFMLTWSGCSCLSLLEAAPGAWETCPRPIEETR